MARTDLLTNGDFSSGDTTGWTLTSATGSVANNKLTLTSTVASISGRAIQAFSTTVGKKYRVTGYIQAGTGPARFAIQDGTTFQFLNQETIESSTYQLVSADFIATSTSTRVFLRVETAVSGSTALFGGFVAYELDHNLKTVFGEGFNLEDAVEVAYVESPGTAGNKTTANWTQVPLNTVVYNDLGAFFTNGLVYLPEGYYLCRGTCTVNKIGFTSLEVQEVTSQRLRSTSDVTQNTGASDTIMVAEGVIYSDGSLYYRMAAYGALRADGFGRDSGSGDNEVYATLRFERLNI